MLRCQLSSDHEYQFNQSHTKEGMLSECLNAITHQPFSSHRTDLVQVQPLTGPVFNTWTVLWHLQVRLSLVDFKLFYHAPSWYEAEVWKLRLRQQRIRITWSSLVLSSNTPCAVDLLNQAWSKRVLLVWYTWGCSISYKAHACTQKVELKSKPSSLIYNPAEYSMQIPPTWICKKGHTAYVHQSDLTNSETFWAPCAQKQSIIQSQTGLHNEPWKRHMMCLHVLSSQTNHAHSRI